ncbi:hypothetical protein D3C85_921820 [compost metagenome]
MFTVGFWISTTLIVGKVTLHELKSVTTILYSPNGGNGLLIGIITGSVSCPKSTPFRL